MATRSGGASVRGYVDAVVRGDKRAAAKLISLIEDDEPEAGEALTLVHPHTGRAHLVGFTGPPGVGKSSLISRLVRTFRARGKRVGVVGVDPTSPFTGGAVLGDRIRMAETGLDPGVFIRSMATRGHAGGLALATFDAVRVIEALGMDIVFIETVGAGQSEVEIATRAHTTVVVEMPLTGDVVQTMKAGILEIGDVYVVNKVDLGDADALVGNLTFQIEARDGWTPPIVRTSALEDRGVAELADAIAGHRSHIEATGALRRKEVDRARREILETAQRLLEHRVRAAGTGKGEFESLANRVADRTLDPRKAATVLLERGRRKARPRTPAKRRR
ncbi:MAG: methylmalonyl Co-A mutase-associated GTPase MeaB [Methanobacteriota archaeon]